VIPAGPVSLMFGHRDSSVVELTVAMGPHDILRPHLEPPHPALEGLFVCQVHRSPIAEYLLRGIEAALAEGDGRFGTTLNDTIVEGDRVVVRLSEDEYVVPDPLQGELPTAEFLRLLSEWITALKVHGR
jgi:hypothetical protein